MSVANFAGRLKELRVAAGLTQEALAERAKMSKAGIADLEQGRREPSWATVIALAEALSVTCQAFLEKPSQPTTETKRGRPPKRGSVQSEEPRPLSLTPPDTGTRKEPKKGPHRRRGGQ